MRIEEYVRGLANQKELIISINYTTNYN